MKFKVIINILLLASLMIFGSCTPESKNADPVTIENATQPPAPTLPDFTALVNQVGGQADPTTNMPIMFRVVFGAKINPSTFVVSDIVQNGTATGIEWEIVNLGNNQSFNLMATSVATGGTLIPSIDAGSVDGLNSNANLASVAADNSVTYYGTPAKLAFSQQPTNTPTSVNISPAITVEIQDATGNVVTNATDNVTLAFGTDPSGGSAILGGTLTIAAVNGVATFSDIQIDVGKTGYTLSATSGALTSATSNSFDITLAATKLKFSVNPTDSNPNANVSPAIKVEIRDVHDALVTSATNTVNIALQNDPSSGSATLGGTLSVAAVNGVATFSDIRLDIENAGYTLVATATGLTQNISTPFNILPAPPSSIILISPVSSPDSDATPTVRVGTVATGEIVKVYDDASCTTVVGNFTATGSTVDITTTVLTEGVHTLYATRSVGGNTSVCSTANLSYEVLGSFDQLDNMNTFGNWSNVDRDQGDWTTNTGQTPSHNVGPLTGNGGSGSYAYTEASDADDSDEFWLESNILDGATYPLAFDFYWNKRGTSMGDLYLEASSNGGATWKQVWSHLGQDMPTGPTDAWRHQFVDLCTLGYTTANVKLRFRGVMPSAGTIRNSDMAIDDLHFSSGGCVPAPPATVAITSPAASTVINLTSHTAFTVSGTCSDSGQNVILSGDVAGTTSCSGGTWSFLLDLSAHADGNIVVNVDHTSASGGANGTDSITYTKDTTILQYDDFDTDLGNWINVAYEQRDWSLLTGETPPNNVGPTGDQSGGGAGQYVYTEASNPVAANDEFVLESNSLAAGNYNLLVEFYWNKRGDSMGDLYLEVSTDGGTNWDPASWSHLGVDVASGDADVWNFQSVDLCNLGYTTGNIKLRFRAVMPAAGNTWNSDIAIDSVKVKTTGCP